MTTTPSQAEAIIEAARLAQEALRQLNRATIERPTLPPTDISRVLAHLAGVAAALPQSAGQLAEMLESAGRDLDLATDSLSDSPSGSLSAGDDPVVAIDTARLHLDRVREPSVALYRHLDGACQQTAHLSAALPPSDTADNVVRSPLEPPLGRPEHRDPQLGPPGDLGPTP